MGSATPIPPAGELVDVRILELMLETNELLATRIVALRDGGTEPASLEGRQMALAHLDIALMNLRAGPDLATLMASNAAPGREQPARADDRGSYVGLQRSGSQPAPGRDPRLPPGRNHP